MAENGGLEGSVNSESGSTQKFSNVARETSLSPAIFSNGFVAISCANKEKAIDNF